MAEVIYQDPIKEIKGAIAKHGVINRRKVYRDEKGRVIHEGTPEAYRVKHPRDWDKNPPQGEELKKINRFREACHRTTAILRAADPANQPTMEELALYESYNDRFQKQLKRKADPAAPIDPKTGKPKHYYRLDNFIRAMIYQELKSQSPQT